MLEVKATAISPSVTKIFRKIIQDINKDNPTKLLDKHSYWPECNGGIMAVHVEMIRSIKGFPAYSIAHYYKQNGDMMADPEMTFVDVLGLFFPTSFTQHNLGLYQESLIWTGEGWRLTPSMQKDHASFANQWLQNIKEQQDL